MATAGPPRSAAPPTVLECSELDEQGRPIDPVTLEPIPRARLVSWIEGGHRWCFDVDTLAQIVDRAGAPERALNPITRRPLPREAIGEVRRYETGNERVLRLESLHARPPQEVRVRGSAPLGDAVLALFRAVPELGGIRGVGDWDLLLPSGSLYQHYDLNAPVDSVTGSVPGASVVVHASNLSLLQPPVRYQRQQRVWTALERFARQRHLVWLIDLEPQEFRRANAPPLPALTPQAYQALVVRVQALNASGADGADRIRALRAPLSTAYLSAEQARSLVAMMPADMPGEGVLERMIYARVVDRWNLTRGGLEDYYFRSRYAPAPTFEP